MATADPILGGVERLWDQPERLNTSRLTLDTCNLNLDVMHDLLLANVDLEEFTNRMHVLASGIGELPQSATSA